MKTNVLVPFWVCLLLLTGENEALTQGSFQNLDFESPVLPLTPDPVFQVPISHALPGWSGYVGGVQVDRVNYNAVSLGAPAINILGPGSLEPVLQGQYCVYLQPGIGPGFVSVAIGETGTIPTSAMSVRFLMARAAPEVSFAGQQLPIYVLGAGPGEALIYGADVSRWAGQSGELRFGGAGILDDIQFSTNPVPEPGMLALAGLGVLLVGSRLLRAAKRS